MATKMNQLRPTIVAVCGDAGGANAVDPVLSLLRADGRYSLQPLAYSQAQSVWAARATSFNPIDESLNINGAVLLLKELNAVLLLTGTSCNSVDLEKIFIAAAKSMGIPSLSVLDFWSNYACRFSDDSGNLAYVPDRIAVMDELAMEEMIKAGVPTGKISVTGQPALDELVKDCRRMTPLRCVDVKVTLGLDPDDLMVLFVSQPIPASLGEGFPSSRIDPGYSRLSVLDLLVPALDRIAQRRSSKLALVIRPHPRECLSGLERWRVKTIKLDESGEGVGRDVVQAARYFDSTVLSSTPATAFFSSSPIVTYAGKGISRTGLPPLTAN